MLLWGSALRGTCASTGIAPDLCAIKQKVKNMAMGCKVSGVSWIVQEYPRSPAGISSLAVLVCLQQRALCSNTDPVVLSAKPVPKSIKSKN